MKDETGMTACKNGNLALRTDEEGLARDERKGPGRRWAITGSAGSRVPAAAAGEIYL